MLVAISVLASAMSIVFRSVRWLRVATVMTLVLFAVCEVFMRLMQAARFGQSTDVALLVSTVQYHIAYKDGLLAAQRVVNQDIAILLTLFACLAVLAVVPALPKERVSRSPG